MSGRRSTALHVRLLYGSGFPHTPKLLAEDAPELVDELRNALGRRIYNLSLGVDLARTGDND